MRTHLTVVPKKQGYCMRWNKLDPIKMLFSLRAEVLKLRPVFFKVK